MVGRTLGPGLKRFFGELWDDIVGFFKSAWERIKPVVDAIMTVAEFSPVGLAVKGVRSLMADSDRPSLGAAQVPFAPLRPQQTEARVLVDFSNLPRGARVTQEPGGTAPLDMSMGFSAVAP